MSTKASRNADIETDDIDYDAKGIDDLRHIHDKAMWAGSSKKLSEEEMITFNIAPKERALTLRHCRVKIYDAVSKCYDELIVNAVDHIAACRGYAKSQQVSYIDINFDAKTGVFKIRNDGKGIDISRFPETDKKRALLYKPYVYFTHEKQGSNAFKKDECIKAGVNGYGVKIVLAHSAEISVLCGNAAQQKTYTHTHRNDPETGEYIMGEPTVKRDQFTDDFVEVSFRLISEGPLAPKENISNKDIDHWITRRLVYIASYVRTLTKTFKLKPVRFTYNGEDLSWITLDSIANAFKRPDTEIVSVELKPKTDSILLNDDDVSEIALYPMTFILCIRSDASKVSTISNTNGTLINEGDHFKPLLEQISSAIIKKIKKMINNSEVTLSAENIRSICLTFINAIIPGLEFGEQSKKRAIVDSQICQQYSLGKEDLKKIINMISGLLLEKSIANIEKKMSSKIKMSDKYTDACLRSKNRSDFILILCEGDSAMNNIKSCISSLDKDFNIDKIGFLTLFGGVPNVRKNCTRLIEDGHEEITIVDDTTINNVFINTLQKALGVKINEPANRGTMRYGKIIACVDQDLDGKGKLFGLVLNIIHYFWPSLLEAGDFLYKLETPIERIYKNKKLLAEFYYEHESRAYQESQKLPVGAKKHYFKGLATHTPAEMRVICRTLFQKIKGYKLDSYAHKLITQYYDDDSDERKLLLSKPLSFADKYFLRNDHFGEVNISDYLNSDLFSFAKDDIMRKLPNAIDGLNSSGRKIVNGIITKMKTKEITKVAELAGSITKSQNYHHGEKVLEDNIKNKCFVNVGGRQLPVLLPRGNFGSRLCGGAHAGESRYIFASHNIDLTSKLYPAADYGLLKFTPDGGVCYEPDYFVPILPMAILETMGMPAHGWNFNVVARDVFGVINCVRQMIITPTYQPLGPLNMALHGFTGEYYYDFATNKEYTEGTFSIGSDDIHVTEVPIGVWLNKYILELNAKIVFYEIDATISAVRVEDDNSVSFRIIYGKKFWDKIDVNGTVAMTKISKKNIEEVFGKDVLAKPKKKGAKTTKGTKGTKGTKSTKRPKKDTDANDKPKSIEIKTPTNIDPALNKFNKILPAGQKYNLASFLCLKKQHTTSLNMVGADASVITFGTYFEVIKYWFDYRRAMYVKRVNRETLIRQLEIEMLHDKIVFIEKYDTTKKKPEAVMKKEIRELGLRAFNHVLVNNPGCTPTESLIEECMQPDECGKVTFDYVLNIRARELCSDEYLRKIRKEYAAKKVQFEVYKTNANFGYFKGSMFWLDELNAVEKVIRDGIESMWDM